MANVHQRTYEDQIQNSTRPWLMLVLKAGRVEETLPPKPHSQKTEVDEFKASNVTDLRVHVLRLSR